MKFSIPSLFALSLALIFSEVSRADFGEIDILVRESIESHFNDYGRSVDLNRLSYIGEPTVNGRRMTVRSSVWAEQRQIAPYWGWHECTTQLEIKSPGRYSDLGSDCFFDFD